MSCALTGTLSSAYREAQFEISTDELGRATLAVHIKLCVRLICAHILSYIKLRTAAGTPFHCNKKQIIHRSFSGPSVRKVSLATNTRQFRSVSSARPFVFAA